MPSNTYAFIIKGGYFEDMLYAFNFASILAVSHKKVRILFVGWAASKLKKGNLDKIDIPSSLHDQKSFFVDQLKKHKTHNLEDLLKLVKSAGDVKIYICSLAASVWGVTRENMIPEVDDLMGSPNFLLSEAKDAAHILTF
ncbi:DsrE/DsrF/DrsH-like family protein [Candidatus Saganbacteria bacterium]|nr:DsrE/DsrF/DrsH-like family protein [Candidatus Saganbacteria bacterium]